MLTVCRLSVDKKAYKGTKKNAHLQTFPQKNVHGSAFLVE
jgi:hypothetical protein